MKSILQDFSAYSGVETGKFSAIYRVNNARKSAKEKGEYHFSTLLNMMMVFRIEPCEYDRHSNTERGDKSLNVVNKLQLKLQLMNDKATSKTSSFSKLKQSISLQRQKTSYWRWQEDSKLATEEATKSLLTWNLIKYSITTTKW